MYGKGREGAKCPKLIFCSTIIGGNEGLRQIGYFEGKRKGGMRRESGVRICESPRGKFPRATRPHHRLHWRLDVTMNEDAARNRMDNGPHNLAVLRHMALNVMGREESKTSLRAKFKKAAWDHDYLVKLLALF